MNDLPECMKGHVRGGGSRHRTAYIERRQVTCQPTFLLT